MNEKLEQIEALQNHLVDYSTNGGGDEALYQQQRKYLLEQADLEHLTPSFVRTNRTLGQFWQFIKQKFKTYQERRQFLWNEFRPLLEFVERGGAAPSDRFVSAVIEKYDAEHVHKTWAKALERREVDPEGAITIARTLLESVCKHILDERGVSYGDSPDLNQLYKATATALNLAPSQHTEQVFKQILGGCTAVVEGLGALRNRLSDSHGKGRVAARPAPRHAELTVNLAGSVAMFLIATAETKQNGEKI
ncbi:abortive infection family protein [Ralstonia pseudosolanacearum]|uniref:abortive infection family protein n=1 Tax=Ralstonia pseudosolanacearum TaxID=1310165 RepID=UPI003D2F1F6A